MRGANGRVFTRTTGARRASGTCACGARELIVRVLDAPEPSHSPPPCRPPVERQRRAHSMRAGFIHLPAAVTVASARLGASTRTRPSGPGVPAACRTSRGRRGCSSTLSPPALWAFCPRTGLPRGPARARWLGCATPTATAPPPVDEAKRAASAPTLSDLKALLKDKSSKGAVRKVLNTMMETEDGTGPYGHLRPDADAYRTAVRCLLRASRTDLAFDAYKLRMAARERRPDELGDDVGLAASVARAVIRDGKKRNQVEVDQAVLYDDIKRDCTAEPLDPATAARKAAAICTLVAALLDADKVKETRVKDAVRMVALLRVISLAAERSAAVPVADYNNCIRLLGKKRRLDGVFSIVDCMRLTGVEQNNETFEFLANAVVRRVEFVTGAVSMDTLPEPLLAEVAFVGRSNVGKSSLVNMICNRKALAYVSGRPGKTQQFNYFLVNAGEKDSSFYLVDLPGVGYARVAKTVQAEWLSFMDAYLGSRPSLEVVFHLVDGRHGALGDDELLMRQVAKSRFSGQYVVVLTKMDKLDKQRVKQSTLDKTRATLVQNGCPPDTPILLTSASSRLGRDEVWRYLQRAIRIS
jgi:ribosome biogenesis GTP-binding protein YsxC/EngB